MYFYTKENIYFIDYEEEDHSLSMFYFYGLKMRIYTYIPLCFEGFSPCCI
jgi:hypothetical protein